MDGSVSGQHPHMVNGFGAAAAAAGYLFWLGFWCVCLGPLGLLSYWSWEDEERLDGRYTGQHWQQQQRPPPLLLLLLGVSLSLLVCGCVLYIEASCAVLPCRAVPHLCIMVWRGRRVMCCGVLCLALLRLHQPAWRQGLRGVWGSFLSHRLAASSATHSCSYSSCCCCADAALYSKLLQQMCSLKVCHLVVLRHAGCGWRTLCVSGAADVLQLAWCFTYTCAVLWCEMLCFFGYVTRQPATSSSSLPLATNACQADSRGAAAWACIRQLSRQCCLAVLIPVMPSSIITLSTAL